MPGTRRTTDRSKKNRPRGSPELLLELIIEEFIHRRPTVLHLSEPLAERTSTLTGRTVSDCITG
jgi:hypothetical protein